MGNIIIVSGVNKAVFDVMGTTYPESKIGEHTAYFGNHAAAYLEHASAEALAAAQKIREQVERKYGITLASDEMLAGFVLGSLLNKNWAPDIMELSGEVSAYGYRTGGIKREVFPDAERMFQHLARKGIDAFLYSTGGRKALEEMFRTAEDGGVGRLIADYFDTQVVGDKKKPESYENLWRNILRLGSPREMVFVSDRTDEVRPALEAGVQAVFRHNGTEEERPQGANYPIITTLDELAISRLSRD